MSARVCPDLLVLGSLSHAGLQIGVEDDPVGDLELGRQSGALVVVEAFLGGGRGFRCGATGEVGGDPGISLRQFGSGARRRAPLITLNWAGWTVPAWAASKVA